MKKIIILTLFTLICLQAKPQAEMSHWFFGYNAGLDFTQLQTINNATINGVTGQTLTGLPKAVNGPIYTQEGCFSISDRQGNFLFASDGITVYNGTSSANVMKNGTGLNGNSSANQSGIMIPRPETEGHYYIVSAPCRTTSTIKEIYYSEVDFTVTNAQGRGEVLAANKNTKLTLTGSSANQAYENIAAVGHANGRDYWLVHRSRGYFYIWKVTKDGFTALPRVAVGYDPGAPASGGASQLKFSADGKYIITVSNNTLTGYKVTMANFDPNTGDITGIQSRSIPRSSYVYSVEFSPNAKYIYYSNHRSSVAAEVGIYALETANFLSGSLRQLTSNPNISHPPATLQTGPDLRLYCSIPNTKDLQVILDPDEGGYQVVIVPGYLVGTPISGLPTFLASFSKLGSITGTDYSCSTSSQTYSVEVSQGYGVGAFSYLEWDFGDGSAIVQDNDWSSIVHSQTHTYTKPGKYTITITPYLMPGSPVNDKILTFDTTVSPCVVPVNPNIHIAK